PEHDLKASSPKLGQVLEKRVDPRYVLSDHLWKYLQDYRDRHRKAGNGFGFGLTPRTGVARTLSARYYKDGSEILVPVRGKNPRRLTPRECARLMGFPDSFTIPVSDTQAYRQFGNSVVVPLVRFIAGAVLEALGDDGRIPVKKRGSKPMLPQKGIIESPVQTTMPGLRLKRNQGKQKVKRSNRKVG
ncbi:DNA cytosine methyltransferase, partial [bacterium]|nr:DNA cytosine methyltransferase [bacterium]